MGCSSPSVLESPYTRCSFTINNIASELLKVFSIGNNKLLSCSSTTYQIMNIGEEGEPETIEFEKEIYTATIAERKDGLKLIEGTCNGTIFIEDIETDDMLELEGHESTVVCLLMLRNGRLCSCAADGQVIIWNIKNGKDLSNFYPHEKIIWSIVELEDGRLFSVSEDNTANIVSYKKQVKLDVSFEAVKSKCALQLADGRIVYNSNRDIYVYQLDKLPDMNIPENLKGKKQFQPDHIIKEGHIGCIVCMIQLRSGELCTGGEEGLIKLWSIKDNFQLITELTGHRTKINDIIETFDGKLISCSDDRSIKIWIP